MLKACSFSRSHIAFRWFLPQCADIVIFDRTSSDIFDGYLSEHRVAYLSTRKEEIWLLVLIAALFVRVIKPMPLRMSYYYVFLLVTRPSVVLTAIDNNLDFFRLKGLLPHVKTVFIQNGRRSINRDLFSSIDKADRIKNYVDKMFVFSLPVADLYSEYVMGSFELTGSFRLNKFLSKPASSDKRGRSNSITYVSSWRRPKGGNQPFCVSANGLPVSHESCFEVDAMAFKYLMEWARERALRVRVLSPSREHSDLSLQEYKFYEDLASGESDAFEFLVPSTTDEAYASVLSSSLVAGVDSTLCLEGLAAGVRTALFHCRGNALGWKDWSFGWPADLPESGDFWTSTPDRNYFRSALDFAYLSSESEWSESVSMIISEVLEVDIGNSSFVKYIDSI